LSQLMKSVVESLELKIDSIHTWSDSNIVLCWLNDHPSRWKPFVANRVSEIQKLGRDDNWNHIAGKINPADVASRGISPAHLQNHFLWWKAAEWLSDIKITFPGYVPQPSDEALIEEKPKKMNISHIKINEGIFHQFSSLTKLIRVTAWCRRFAHNSNPRNSKIRDPRLNTKELSESMTTLIKIAQFNEFHDEIQLLKKNQPIKNMSKIFNLNPFLKENVLRVGGRLRAAKIPESQKFPILLPKKHKLTELIILHCHLTNLHAGPQLLMSSLRQQYWIINMNDAVRQCVKSCVPCQKIKATIGQQMMADLPSSRVNPGRAFQTVGIDYAGPISILNRKGKGAKAQKGYIAIFVCFVTRAIHVELASDLSTGTFLGALKRFVSRRGKPTHIYSDNGCNFVKANKEMKNNFEFIMSIDKNDAMRHYVEDEQIQWHYNPPSAPHFGGLWEAGIKSIKYHLKRVLQNSRLTIEEMMTLLAQIEACPNSRPLTEMSNDPSDLAVLTPGHFLIGAPLNAIPERDFTTSGINQLTRWQLVTKMLQHFWRRWSGEYLSRLQQRPKWIGEKRDFQIGDIVLLKEDNQPPMKWNLGRIIETHPGADNRVRVVTVKTCNSSYKRPISKLCLLPIENS
jgi:Family of unknown function (DUF5641)/Integrase zinc binding domain